MHAKTKYMDFEIGGRRFYAMVAPMGTPVVLRGPVLLRWRARTQSGPELQPHGSFPMPSSTMPRKTAACRDATELFAPISRVGRLHRRDEMAGGTRAGRGRETEVDVLCQRHRLGEHREAVHDNGQDIL